MTPQEKEIIDRARVFVKAIVKLFDKTENGFRPNVPFERYWHNANFPPKEGGRYWCVVEEQNDLGKSRFQWNCDYNPNDKRWADDGKTMSVIYYTELAPMPV